MAKHTLPAFSSIPRLVHELNLASTGEKGKETHRILYWVITSSTHQHAPNKQMGELFKVSNNLSSKSLSGGKTNLK